MHGEEASDVMESVCSRAIEEASKHHMCDIAPRLAWSGFEYTPSVQYIFAHVQFTDSGFCVVYWAPLETSRYTVKGEVREQYFFQERVTRACEEIE